MHKIKYFVLAILAMLPFTSIATAAYSQINSLAGQNQTDLLRWNISNARRLLFPKGIFAVTIQEAKERLAREKGIEDQNALDDEFGRQIQILMDNGLIETNEQMVMSTVPSAW